MSLIKKNEKRRILEIYSPKSSDEKIIQKINLKQIKITKKKNKSFEKIDFNNEIDSNKATCSFTSEENGFSFFLQTALYNPLLRASSECHVQVD
jgi:hypothetical protein